MESGAKTTITDNESMKRLRLDFENRLKSATDMLVVVGQNSSDFSSSTSSYEPPDNSNLMRQYKLFPDQISHLRSHVNTLNSAGQLGPCIDVYRNSRKAAVESIYSSFQIGSLSINDVRSLDWEECVVKKIKLWIHAAHIFFEIIFPSEKRNYELIFDGVRAATYENCFLAVTSDVAIQLYNFAEAIAKTTLSVQKLFDFLDLYRALLCKLPEIKATFNFLSALSIYLRADAIVHQLSCLVRQILLTFEDTVLNEQSNTPVPGGNIHRVATYTLDYVIRILDYRELFIENIITTPGTGSCSFVEIQNLEVEGIRTTPFALHLTWIVMCLKNNLEAKSKHYDNDSLRHVFMINNLHYIFQKIEGAPQLLEMIGENYLMKFKEEVLQKMELYFEDTWDKVLYYFRHEGLHHNLPFYNAFSKSALKERFKNFNAMIEEIFRAQRTWFVPDLHLRIQLHMLILRRLIPAYESFLMRYHTHIVSENNSHKYNTFSTAELENAVSDLFRGDKKYHNWLWTKKE